MFEENIKFTFLFVTVLIICTLTNGAPNKNHHHHQEQQNRQQSKTNQHVTAKKDLFTSRGWGAAGMPFSVFYMNHYARMQQEAATKSATNLLEKQRQQASTRFLDGGQNANALERQLDHGGDDLIDNDDLDGDDQGRSKTNSPRRNYTAPQLFVSYGWGPMGK